MRSKLASSQLGNDDVFEYREETEALDSSVMLLVDASGSMGFDNMREANKTALGFAKAFQRMGIDIEVNYYGVYNQIASRNEIYTAKEFGKKLDVSKFSVASSGGPVAERRGKHTTLARRRPQRHLGADECAWGRVGR